MKEKRVPWWFWKKEEKAAARAVPDYTIVSSVSGAIVKLLRDAMVPELLEGRDMIGLCDPADHKDITLGVWLYDIRENEALRINGMIPYNEEQLQYPPLYLNLHYMITVWSDMDLRYRAESEHRLLTKAMQVMRDSSVLSADTLTPTQEPEPSDLRIEYENFTAEEKLKIWNGINLPYRLSLFYQAAPVELESLIRRNISRVEEIRLEEKQ